MANAKSLTLMSNAGNLEHWFSGDDADTLNVHFNYGNGTSQCRSGVVYDAGEVRALRDFLSEWLKRTGSRKTND